MSGIWLAASAAQAEGVPRAARTEILVVTPLSLVKELDLDFGAIVPGTALGHVTLSPANGITTTNGIVVMGKTQPAAFYGYGRKNQNVRIYLDANQYDLLHSGGVHKMVLDRLTVGSVPPVVIGTAPRTFRITSDDGLFRFTLGGRLQVARNQPVGTYSANFRVSVEYM